MHTFNESGGAGVPAFLAKLWRLVDDPDTNNLICWSKDGRSFIIQNQAQFARELLPLNYKHNNMASFIRQLNMYGFHKITSIENGGLKFDRDEMEFSHPCFKRNSPYLLEHIKRKISNTKQHVEEKAPAIKPEAVTKVLADVKAMRGRQDNLDTRFSEMKQENEALWREIAALRQKHTKQQQIVNKLIQFLITIVQPSMKPTMKRHMQLMINDIPENARLRTSSDSESECGPVIHELGEELLAESDELMNPESPYNYFAGGSEGDMVSHVKEERPQSSISQYECSNHSLEDASNMRADTPNSRNGATISIGSPVSPCIIQSMNPDGTGVVYHVTEAPDMPVAQDSSNAVLFEPDSGAVAFNEENVLTTPLVRQQMARSILKQKNKQRRQQRLDADKKADDEAAVAAATAEASTGAKVQQQRSSSKRVAAKKSANASAEQQQVGGQEQPLDPMQFLTVYNEDNEFSNDANMMSPNTGGFIEAGNTNSNASGNGVYTAVAANNGQNATLNQTAETRSDAYETNQYMVNDMPTLFDDASLISNDSNLGDSFKLQQQQQQQQQQQEQEQFGQATTSNGKFSSYLVTPSTVDTSPSTSAAAKRSAQAKKSLNQTAANSPTPSTGGDNMAVTKYRNEDILRLSTANDVSDHLENVQDELDTLKDLLKGDGYSLDATTLMGNHGAPEVSAPAGFSFAQGFGLDGEYLAKLFNDSDLLGPYGLSFNGDMPQGDKKGSELMAYQPSFDLADIISGIDDKSNDAESSLSALGDISGAVKAETGSTTLARNPSMLNTP